MKRNILKFNQTILEIGNFESYRVRINSNEFNTAILAFDSPKINPVFRSALTTF